MFERMTERARQVVVFANAEANRWQAEDDIYEARSAAGPLISSLHLLAGLVLEDEGIAARLLMDHDVTLELVRQNTETVEWQTSQSLPFTDFAKKVLEATSREALSLGHNYIGTEHILLALVRWDVCLGARVVASRVDAVQVRNDVIGVVGQGSKKRDCLSQSNYPERQKPSGASHLDRGLRRPSRLARRPRPAAAP